MIKALKEGKTRVHFNKEWTVNTDRPERGKVIENMERKKYLKKTAIINWIGLAAFTGKKQEPVIVFFIAMIVLGIFLSLLL